MKQQYIIGIDGGSQSSKVIIFDLEGNVVCEGKEPLKAMHLPEPGIVEHPDDDLWDSIAMASQKAMQSFRGDPSQILGIGLCTIRFCRCLLREDGTLAQPAMSWMDARVSRCYSHENKNVTHVTTSSGYITRRLTGECKDTAANYQGVWPMDTDQWDWLAKDEDFQAYNLPREMLFDLVMPGDLLGHVTREASEYTGIPEGIPVIATANDKAVEALGAGLLNDQTVLVSLGTYIAAMMHGKENPKNTAHFWTNFASRPRQYLYESHGIRRGMWTVSWFKDMIGEELVNKATAQNIKPEEVLNHEASNVAPGCDGLMTVLDWLAPSDQPFKKGMMIGFDGRHTRSHMYRSILEAIALTMKNRCDDMADELGIEIRQLIISGGGSSSQLFMQIFSDVFGIPVRRTAVNDSASLGSAICACVGLGIYSSYEEAVKAMVKPGDEFAPNLQHYHLYSRINREVYRNITNYTDPLLEKTHALFS